MPTVVPNLSDRAYHEFLRATKLFWSRDMYDALRQDFMSKGLQEQPVDVAEREMREDVGYQFFGWFERNLQKEKYASPHGLIAIVGQRRAELEKELADAAADGMQRGLLKLNPALVLPEYYAKTEFHQHPGGVWSDELAGFAYELGRRTTMPLHMDPYDVHLRVAETVPKDNYKRILDLGCGTGRSTLPFAKLYPGAELFGIDVSAPCLKLAYLTARDAGVDVHWSQQMAEKTDFADQSFDLIHSTFLLHELPVKAVEQVTREVARLLMPGGVFANLDFHSPPGGTWGSFIHFGHALMANIRINCR